MHQIIGHKLRWQNMVCIGMPLRLHVLFGVPVDLALQVTTDQANGALHGSHRVAVGISRHGFKLTIYKGGAIIKIHAWFRKTRCIWARTSDILDLSKLRPEGGSTVSKYCI